MNEIICVLSVSFVAFAGLGLVQRWSLRLSVAYAATMTAFIGILGAIASAATA